MHRSDFALGQLGKTVARLRVERNMTQEALAQEAGLSVSFVSLLERGERSPSYETVLALAEALSVSPARLVDEGRDLPTPRGAQANRLAAFAQRARLTAGQVDRLIAVAGAMFAMGLVRTVETPCSERDCGRTVLARGLCPVHYHRERRRRTAVLGEIR